MKTQVEIYQPPSPENPSIPKCLERNRSYIVQVVTALMRMHGVSKITLTYTAVGIKSLVDVKIAKLPITPPRELEASRNFIVRTLSSLLELYGILNITILPNTEELHAIEKGWAVMAGEAEPEQTEVIGIDIEEDPTLPVIDEAANDTTKQQPATA